MKKFALLLSFVFVAVENESSIATGASFTGVMVMFSGYAADVSTPPLTLPPSSWAVT